MGLYFDSTKIVILVVICKFSRGVIRAETARNYIKQHNHARNHTKPHETGLAKISGGIFASSKERKPVIRFSATSYELQAAD